MSFPFCPCRILSLSICGLLIKQSMGCVSAGHLLILWAFVSDSVFFPPPPRPEAANEFYDGDHDNDKESDVEI